MSVELNKLSRRQKVVLLLICVPLLLFALGVAGLQVAWFPHDVAVAAVLIACVIPMYLIPIRRISALRREQGVRDGSLSWLAVKQRWQMAISGTCVALVGALLLVPIQNSTPGLHIAGVVALAWGALIVWAAVLRHWL